METEFQNLIFPEECLFGRDIRLFWSRDYNRIKSIPKTITSRTFWFSMKFKELKNQPDENPHEFAIMELLYELRSYSGRALAEIIIEDFCKRFENDNRLYSIELANSKFFFDSENMIYQLKTASKNSNSKRECIDIMKKEFGAVYAREFSALADYKKY